MRLPKMRAPSAKSLSIADFSGGLNLRDGMSEILNNQLTDSVNMWWKDGVLKTRPNLVQKAEASDKEPFCYDWTDYTESLKKHDVFKYDDYNGPCELCSAVITYTRPSGADTVISFWWVSSSGIEWASRLEISGGISNYFVIQKNKTLYCFTSQQKIYTSDEAKEWTEVKEEDMYVPLVVAYCNPTGNNVNTQEEIMASGTMIEGFNLLGSYYKISYNSYNPNSNNLSTTGAHQMSYPLLESTKSSEYEGKTVVLEHTIGGKVATHTVVLPGKMSWVYENTVNETDGLVLGVCGKMCKLGKYNDAGNFVEEWISSGGENDIVITAPYITDDFKNLKNKVFQMTRTEWFGGASAGLAGGTRLFLCGNTDDDEKSLVVWSGLNNPLYFPENAYFYVGNTSSAVTGFGKQSDMLIIFKENETWYTQYYQNTDITADDLINQSVVDYTASSVYFPLVQINPNIGCPYPDTVQLCRNRLVWLGGNVNVYTLVSDSQYNERSIFSVSEMVQSRLKGEIPDNASACDWDGYYCLRFDNKFYLMDYNTYGYTHVASYSKTEDANIRIPWYYWETPRDIWSKKAMLVIQDVLLIASYVWGGRVTSSSMRLELFDTEGTTGITELNINSSVTTKLFSFSAPSYRKNIDRIDIQFGNNGGDSITAEIITDSGSEEHIIELTNGNTDNKSGEYLQNKAIFPCLRQVSRMAVKLSSQGPLILDGMSIKYRITGGVR